MVDTCNGEEKNRFQSHKQACVVEKAERESEIRFF